MRIEQNSSVATNGASSGTKKIGGVFLPDFDNFHYNTKTTPTMNDDKFKETIIEQAKKDQAAGKFQGQSAAYKNLMKNYVSVASPDRKGFITEALTQIAKKPPTKNINYLDLLFGKVTYEKSTQQGLTYAEFYDKNGELIGSYSATGVQWTFFETKAERSRSDEFLSIYNNAWDNAAKGAKNAALANAPVISVDEISLDIKA